MSNDLTVYNKYKDCMKSMDGFGYKSNELLGKTIRIWSPDWNHAGLFIPLDSHSGFNCRNWTLEAVKPRVHLTLLSKKLEKYNGEVWWFPLKDKYDPLRQMGERFILDYEGTDYDFKSLFKNMFGWVSLNAFQLFCSELDFFGYRHMGIVKGVKAPTPSGLFRKYPIFKEPVKIIG